MSNGRIALATAASHSAATNSAADCPTISATTTPVAPTSVTGANGNGNNDAHARAHGARQRSIKSLLTDTVVSEFGVTRGKVLVLNTTTAPGPAFEQLLAAGVQSAPVYNSSTKQFVGFLEVSDLLRLVVTVYDRAEMIAVLAHGLDVLDGPQKSSAKAKAKANAKPKACDEKSKSSAVPSAAVSSAAAPSAPAGSMAEPRKSVTEYIDEILAASNADTTAAGSATADNKMNAAKVTAPAKSSSAHVTPTFATDLTVAALARRHPFVSVPQTATLFDVGKLLCTSAHRVCVVDEWGAVVNVISQSTIIAFLHQNLHRIDPVERDRSVEEWHMGSRPVHCVDMCSRAIDVFRKMLDLQLAGLALTDEFGSFSDFVQSSDLKLFLALFFHQPINSGAAADAAADREGREARGFSSLALEEPICELLMELRQLEASHRIAWTLPSSRLPLTIASSSAPSLADVVTRLAATHSHQLTITLQLDEYLRIPMLMVSLGDILRGVYRYVPPELDAAAVRWVGSVQKAANDSAKAAEDIKADVTGTATVAPTAKQVQAAAAATAAAAPAAAVAAPGAGAVDSKHVTTAKPAATVALTVAALPEALAAGFTTAAQALVAAATHLASITKDAAFEPLLQEVHRKYEAVAALAASFPRRPSQTGQPPARKSDGQKQVRDASSDHALPKAFNSAFNQCHHGGEHLFSDHGHCLRATHTCARLHTNPPACEWTDGRRFCVFDLGYTAGERLEREAHAKRAPQPNDAAVSISAELHAAAAAHANPQPKSQGPCACAKKH